ncbi:Anosmin-1 [Clonorchis sinensis]|uniref:Anosmin-1 n=1 Tax=Clonorchis sinensis TaxID=79923 RepID=A0A8T1MPF3_CLOSI|nr:Anosmin-1 [Clonorchis sinensis]
MRLHELSCSSAAIGLLLTLICSIYNGSARKLTASWMEERLFLRARCKAKCLRLFQNPLEQKEFQVRWSPDAKSSVGFSDCFVKDSENCSSQSEEVGCHIGCSLLLDSVSLRPGQCPLAALANPEVEQASDKSVDQSACLNMCRSDNDCLNPLYKCCSLGCRQICIEPQLNNTVPSLPEALNPIESKASPGIMELDWSGPYARANKVIGPIVFILQTRICICKQLSPAQLTDWQTLIMTHEFGAKLDAFEPGKMYQFRIAAVSPHGTRGFGPPSQPYPIDPVPPNPPSPPRNLTDSMWRFYSNGNIHVLLNWVPPEHSELTVTEYLIDWVIDHGYVQPGGHSLEGLTKFTHTVPAEQTQYVLQELRPSTAYKVQVRAMSYWHGYGPLESQPNTIFLFTQSVMPAYHQQATMVRHSNELLHTKPKDETREESVACECGTKSALGIPLQLKKVFYDSGELIAAFAFTPPTPASTYQLNWSPQVCINAKENSAVLSQKSLRVQGTKRVVFLKDLRFNCRYMVQLRQLTHELSSKDELLWPPVHSEVSQPQDGHPYTAQNCFCTPSCLDVEISRGDSPKNCSLPDPGPPPPPLNLRAVRVEDMRYRITWKPPILAELQNRLVRRQQVRSAPLPSVTKYRVLWAPRIEEPVIREMYNDEVGFSPIMDLQQSDVRIVDKNQTWIDLPNLKEKTLYIVRVQTLSALDHQGYERESSPAVLYFVTPQTNRPGTHAHSLGFIRSSQLGNALRWLKLIPSNAEIASLLEVINPSKTGLISLELFLAAAVELWYGPITNLELELWKAFEKFDKRLCGYVSSDKMYDILTRFGCEPIPEQEAIKLIKRFEDKNQRIYYAEMVRELLR